MNLRKVFTTALAACLVAGGALAVVTPAYAEPIPVSDWVAPLPSQQANTMVATHSSGGVSVGCEDPFAGPAIRSFNQAGTPTQTVGQTSPIINMCEPLVGDDGTVYAPSQGTLNDSFSVNTFKAYKAGQVLWTYNVPCGGYIYSTSMDASAIYLLATGMSGCANHSAVIGLSLKPLTGESVPQQLFEVPLAGDLGLVAPFQGGFVVANASRHQYYVGGVPQAAVERYRGFEGFSANAETGRTFVAVEGNSTDRSKCLGRAVTTSVEAYEPTGLKWTLPMPTCTRAKLSPMPGGGAVMLSWQVTSQYGTVFNLAALNALGARVWERPIFTSQPSGMSTFFDVTADVNGNVAVQAKVTISKTINSQYRSFPESWFALFSGATGAEVSGTRITLRGDNSTAAGPSYDLLNWRRMAIGANRVYFAVKPCTSLPDPCDNQQARLYAFRAPGVALDYPRGALLKAVSAPATYKWVSWLGDSFSAGVGAGNYYPETTVPATQDNYNECYRSRNAYSRVLAADTRLAIRDAGFWACTGAETKHIVDVTQYGPYAQPPQSMFLSPAVGYVVLTLGGNDIGFGDLARACAIPTTTCKGVPHQTAVGKINNVLPGNMERAFDAIRARVGASTKVLLVNYPMMVNAPSSASSSCGVLSADEMTAVRDVITKLNAKLAESVAAANRKSGATGTQFVLVDVNKTGSPFRGRELCTSSPAFNALRLASGSVSAIAVESFHPNQSGQSLYAQLVRPYLPAA